MRRMYKTKPSSLSLCISWLHVTTSNWSDICSQPIGSRTRQQLGAWKDGEYLRGERSSKYTLMTCRSFNPHNVGTLSVTFCSQRRGSLQMLKVAWEPEIDSYVVLRDENMRQECFGGRRDIPDSRIQGHSGWSFHLRLGRCWGRTLSRADD